MLMLWYAHFHNLCDHEIPPCTGLGAQGVQPSDFSTEVLRAAGLDANGSPVCRDLEGSPPSVSDGEADEVVKIVIGAADANGSHGKTNGQHEDVEGGEVTDAPDTEKWGAPWHQQVGDIPFCLTLCLVCLVLLSVTEQPLCGRTQF